MCKWHSNGTCLLFSIQNFHLNNLLLPSSVPTIAVLKLAPKFCNDLSALLGSYLIGPVSLPNGCVPAHLNVIIFWSYLIWQSADFAFHCHNLAALIFQHHLWGSRLDSQLGIITWPLVHPALLILLIESRPLGALDSVAWLEKPLFI